MADNFHSLDTEEIDQEQLELDMVAVKAKTDLITVSGNINLDTVGTNQTTFTNKLSGASSSGLKTLIEGNDTDITSINEKLAGTSSSGLKTLIDVNTAKVSFPGIGTSASTCLAGNTTTITGTQASKILANENAITAIENKTDFISITQNVDLDTIESDVNNNNNTTTNFGNLINNSLSCALKNSLDTNTSNINGILNNSLSSNLKTAVDTNSAKVSSQWSNNGSEIYINENVGINNTNPNCDLEIGNSTGVVRLRLNGSNNLFTSSELLFTDNLSNTAEYFQGAGIRFNSFDNKLQFITDNGNDGTAEIQMSINRSDGFIGIKDTTPSFELDVNGEINAMKQYHYYQSGIPMIIGITSIHSQLVSYHRLGYGNGAGNGGGSITENTFFQPHTDFKVVFRPFSSKVYIDIKFVMDRYFSGRNLVWALGTSSSASSIIGRTLTFHRSADSEWTSRQEVVRLHDQGFTAYTSYVRYIFVKSIVVNSDNTIGSTSGNTGWILWGGWGTHSNGGGQTTGHYQSDSTPHLPTNSDNFGPLEAVVYGIPDSFTTSASTSNPLQYIGY